MKGMSAYGEFDGGLYGGVLETAAASESDATPAPDSALEVAAQPGGPDLPPSVLASDPAVSSGPSIPFGLAILGVCAVAVMWAASLDGGKE